MTRDDRLAAYVREQYADLVATAALLCADSRDAAPLVVTTLARLRARPRWLRGLGSDATDLDSAVRRRLTQACVTHDRRQRRDARGRPGDAPVMQVVTALGSLQRGPDDLVREAVAELPPRQRAALVLRHLGQEPAGDERTARDAYAGLLAVAAVLGVDPVDSLTGDGSSRTEVMIARAFDAGSPRAAVSADPARLVEQRTRSLVRRRSVVGAAAVVVAVIVGAQVLTGGSDSVVTPVSRVAAATPPTPPHALVRQPTAYPSGVATGGGYLWTIELHPGSRRPRTTVVRRSLSTGVVERSYHVPGEDFGISYGLGRLWTWGADAHRTLTSDISVINPTTGDVRTSSVGRGQIRDVAFAGGRAWFSQGAHNRVIALDPRLGLTSYVANGATDVAAYGPDAVVVLGSAGDLIELPSEAAINHNDTTLTYLSGTPQDGVWIGHGRQATYSPSIDLPLTVSLKLALPVSHVIGNPQTGVYVATSSSDPLHYDPYLVYYSPISLQATHPRPTVKLGGAVQIESMTADGRGGVVYVQTDGTVVRWDPAPRTQVIAGSESLAGTTR